MNITAFLCFQISQVAIEKISMKNSKWFSLSFLDGVEEVEIMIPMDAKITPTSWAKGALDDEMVCEFFSV
jgi:hypothetical protein